ncbi:MAG: outer membrane beta-barrel protein [Pseudomonadales bacterium]
MYYNAAYDISTSHQLFARLYTKFTPTRRRSSFYKTRDDNFFQLSLGWNWQLSKPLRVRTEFTYDSNNSDVDYYSFERTRLQTGLRYSF